MYNHQPPEYHCPFCAEQNDPDNQEDQVVGQGVGEDLCLQHFESEHERGEAE